MLWEVVAAASAAASVSLRALTPGRAGGYAVRCAFARRALAACLRRASSPLLVAFILALFSVALPAQTPTAGTPDLATLILNASPSDREALLAQHASAIDTGVLLTLAAKADELRQKDKPADSRALSDLAVKLARERDAWRPLAKALTIQANLVSDEQPFVGLELYEQALAAYRKVDDADGVSHVLLDIGITWRQEGDLDRAADYYRQAYEVPKASKEATALALNGLALIDRSRGRMEQAIDSYKRALAIFEEAKNQEAIAGTNNNIGNVYRAQGNGPLASAYFRRALAIAEQIGNPRLVSYCLNNLGSIASEERHFDEALDLFRRSLAIKESRGDRSGVSGALMNIGDVYRLQHDYQHAFSYFQRSLTIANELGERNRMAQCECDLGVMALHDHSPHLALYFATRCESLARLSGGADDAIFATALRGNALEVLGRFDEARLAYEDAVRRTEEFRNHLVGGTNDRQLFLSGKISPYHDLVHLLLKSGHAGEALAAAERVKARVLLEVLRDGHFDPAKSLSAVERERERAMRTSLKSATASVARERGRREVRQPVVAQLEHQLATARDELELFQSNLYSTHPALRVQRGAVSFPDPKDLARMAPPGTALVEFVVAESATMAFVVTRGADGKARITSHAYAIGEQTLAARVETLRGSIARRDLGFRAESRKLFSLLMAPLWPSLRNQKRIVIIPDGSLWDLPFQTLLAKDGRYLIEHAAISYAPSITALREMQRLRESRGGGAQAVTLLALGNPTAGTSHASSEMGGLGPLPQAERQVRAIARLYAPASKVYIGADAGEATLKREGEHCRILHLATHGVFDDAIPMNSHLVLAPPTQPGEDGILEAWEIANLDLKSDLVVLSACESARGKARKGEGVIGMTWALFVAGSPSLVVSQWKVDSASTTDFMLAFYRDRAPASKPGAKSAALRSAALKLLRTSEYAHPFYWGAFVLVGDDGAIGMQKNRTLNAER
jgi:CHAT domain-containing protein/Tfp pilus assembly protein PilF